MRDGITRFRRPDSSLNSLSSTLHGLRHKIGLFKCNTKTEKSSFVSSKPPGSYRIPVSVLACQDAFGRKAAKQWPRHASLLNIIVTCQVFLTMDPGTIIAVVETSVRVLSLIAKYYSTVKKAEEDIRGLKTGVEAIYNVLRRIQELVQSCNETKLLLLASLATPIESASSDIDNIMNTLDSSRGKKAMSRVGLRALQWPFTKKEVEQQIGRLEGHKTTLTLALNSVQA